MQDFFHVHTWRCKHASDETDQEIIEKAISLGAKKITFTDHVPFPENPFGNRMDFEQLEEYLETLSSLKEKYQNQIDVKIGFEVEFVPKYLDYFKQLKNHPKVDILIIGQHFYQFEDAYSFDLDSKFRNENEHIYCFQSMIDGIKTGLFDVVAHPDRCFRRCTDWTEDMEKLSLQLFQVAGEYDIPLEINISSYTKLPKKLIFRKEFWRLLDEYNKTSSKKVKMIYGLDSHSSEDMENRYSIEVEK